jgi:peptide/nickel transport system substrate-binding protein
MPKLHAPFLCLLFAGLLAGCSSHSTSAAGGRARIPLPPDTMTVMTDEIGHTGGRFVIAVTNAPKTFNSMMANETSSSDITERMFIGLADFDNQREVDTPLLAKSWEVSPDGLTWTFHLRRGARFSDGHPITSADVLFSFAVANDTLLHPSVQDLIRIDGQPLGVTAPDSMTVVVVAPKPHALLLSAVSSVRILPRHVLEPVWKAGGFASAYGVTTPPESLVTSGPWRLEQYVPGEKTVLAPNPYWFGVDAKGTRLPYLDELVLVQVPDQSTAALKFKAGEIDGLENVKAEDYPSYQDGQTAGNYHLYDLGPSLNASFFWFNLNRVREPVKGHKVGDPWVGQTKYAWFNDPRFRRAVSMAIDRDAMIQSVYFGQGRKNWATMTPGSRAWFDPAVTGPDYDPDGARKLLAEIGMKDRNGDGVIEDASGHPVSFTIKTNGDNQNRMQMANFTRDDLAKVGIRCTPQSLEMNSLITNMRTDFQYDALLLAIGSGVPPDPGMAPNVYRSRGATHFWNMQQTSPATPAEAEMDSLIEVIMTRRDRTARKQAYAEISRIWNQQVFTIWLPIPVTKVPVRNTFGNVHPTIIPHRLLWNSDRIFARNPARRA